MVDNNRQRPALPFPAQVLRDREKLSKLRDFDKTSLTEKLVRERQDLQYRLELIDANLEAATDWLPASQHETQPTLDQNTERSIKTMQPAIGQLRWMNRLAENYQQIGQSPGNTSGAAWCNGVLISDDCFLMPGHSLDKSGGWQRPSSFGLVPPPDILATLFRVSFTQLDAQQNEQELNFAVDKLIHHRPFGLDCAIVRLKKTLHSKLHAKGAPGSRVRSHLPAPILHDCWQRDKSDASSDEKYFLLEYPALGTRKQHAGVVAHRVNIRHQHDSGFSFYNPNDNYARSGSPLVTSNGRLVGIQLSRTEALAIGAIAQLIINEPQRNQVC